MIPNRLIPKVPSPLQKLGDSNVIGITFSRRNGEIVDSNDEFLRIVGYSRQDLQAGLLNCFDITPPEWAAADRQARETLSSTGKTTAFEKEYLRKDGSRIPVLVGLVALHGRAEDALSFVVDISERKRTELELRQSEQRYRSIVENTHEGICTCDAERRVTYCNGHLAELLGYGQDDRQLVCNEIHFEDDFYEIESKFDRRRQGISESYEKRLRRKDGEAVWVSTSASPVYDDRGEFAGSLCMFSDITERKRLEEQLLQSQKMQAIGQLAGGVAHDFNNLLTVILGYSAVLERRISDDALLKNVVEIRKAGERAAQLTQQLLAFSRKQVLQPRVIAVNQLIQDLEAMLQRLIGENIQLILNLDPRTGNIKADRSQIEQVLMNLSINGRDAMPKGGKLLIETKRQDFDAANGALRSLPAGRYVTIGVTDTGCGMDDQVKSRIFEPFFTTKEPGIGTGLGLSTVLGVINQSGGSISVYSEIDIGTTFKIYLPAVDEVEKLEETRPTPRSRPAGETILVVEDDSSIRALTANILREHGYHAMEVGSAEEAITALEGCPSVSLLLTDLVMTGMNGHDLGNLLGTSHPRLKILYMSGYSGKSIEQQGIGVPELNFLQKPFRPEELLSKVSEILSRNLNSPQVLVIDDDNQIRSFLSSLLELEGYTVFQASNGKQGQEQCKLNHIDLIITDLVMPEQEGLETIHAIRADWPKLPIIAISGAFGGAYLELAKKLGAQAIIRKPFQPDAILAEVRRLTAK